MTDELNQLNDALDNLFEGDSEPVRTEPLRLSPVYKSTEQRFEEGCAKCKGTGKFVSWSGRVLGDCFACKGAGKKTFKTSSETRATNREASAERRERLVQQGFDAFAARFPAEARWLETTAPRWEMAASLLESARNYGSLTEKQMAVVRNGVERDAQRAKRSRTASVEQAGIDCLKASFDQAVAYSAAKGLKLSPRITIDGMTISPAKANSSNPGALYVKNGETYLGKIVNAKFYATGAVTTEHEAKLALFLTDPEQAAKIYGQTTGTCCICNATLISKWKHRGIGPVCAEKFGWA